MLMRQYFIIFIFAAPPLILALCYFWPPAYALLAVVIPVIVLVIQDMLLKKHTVRRLYPFFGRFRYLLESVRPEIQQYFVESDTCLLYTSPSPRDQRGSRMPSSA